MNDVERINYIRSVSQREILRFLQERDELLEELARLRTNRTAGNKPLPESVDLMTEQRDDIGRRRYTLCAIRGEPAMIPDRDGFWTPANDYPKNEIKGALEMCVKEINE